jgi:tetratricopeptide (TPR) repeat protein
VSRDQFHASKPLLVIAAFAPHAKNTGDLSWLERELRYMLIRGRMRVAALGADGSAYTVRIELQQASPTAATVALIAPSGTVERQQQVQLEGGELASMRTLASMLPEFLGAPQGTAQWSSHLGTDDAAAYEIFVRSSQALLGPESPGFTRPLSADSSDIIDGLENLTTRHPEFARAGALLAIAYLNLGGEDEASLTELASSNAERVLALDPTLSDAQSALGLVQLRSGAWGAAMEHFKTALTADPNASAALEGLACLLVDVGHPTEALPLAQRAVMLQPGSIGAAECLNYALLASGAKTSEPATAGAKSLAASQAVALDALLAGELPRAQQILTSADTAHRSNAWMEPLTQAAANQRQTSHALRAVTRAASDRSIDPVTEVVCGTALRQSEFVFNRMLRLHKQEEPVPLRVLWLPRTDFLRKNPRFEEIVSAEGLLPFWQDHGLPDICKTEPDIYGCKIKPQKLKKEE